MSVSRHNFIATSGAGAAALCVSNNASGYTAAEMQPRTAEDKLTGVSKWDLDTPALCVDLDKLERNIATMRHGCAAMKVASRPHGKTHKCPAIAKLQLAGGIDRHLRGKAQRSGGVRRQRHRADPDDDVERLARQDPTGDGAPQDESAIHPGGRYPQNARDLNDAAQGSRHRGRRGRRRGGRHAQRRAGRRPGAGARPARRQAAQPEAARHHQLRRRRAAHQGIQDAPRADARSASRRRSRHSSGSRRRAQHRDFQRRRHRHLQHHAERRGVTDVQVGSYVFMDCQYLEIGGESNDEVYNDFVPSLTVVTTVLNTYFPSRSRPMRARRR